MLRRLFIKSRGLPLLALGCIAFSHSAHASFQWVAPAEEAPVAPAPSPAPLTPTVIAPPASGMTGMTVDPLSIEPMTPLVITGSSKPSSVPTAAPENITPVVVSGASSAPPPSPMPMPAPAPAAAPMPAPSSVGPEISSPIVIGEPVAAPPSAPTPTAEAAPNDDSEAAVYKGPIPDITPAAPPASGMTGVTAVPMATPAAASTVTLSGAADTTSSTLALPAASSSSADVVHGFAKGVPVVVALRQILPPGYAFTIDKDVDMGTLVSFKGGKPWRETLNSALIPAGLAMHETGQMVEISYAGDKVALLKKMATASYQPGMAPHDLQAPTTDTTMPAAADVKPTPPVVIPSPATTIPVAAPESSTVSAVSETWAAERGTSLHKVLEDWCRRAHVEFNWIAEYDYPLDGSVSYEGTFPDAVRSLLTGFESAHPQPVAELHTNPSLGQMVLIVQTRGNTNTD